MEKGEQLLQNCCRFGIYYVHVVLFEEKKIMRLNLKKIRIYLKRVRERNSLRLGMSDISDLRQRIYSQRIFKNSFHYSLELINLSSCFYRNIDAVPYL